MKIVYLVHQFYPECYTGTEKFVLNQAAMMQKFGHRVHVLTCSSYDDACYDGSLGRLLYRKFVYNGIPVTAFKHRLMPQDGNHALYDRDVAAAAGGLIASEKPDVVHAAHLMRLGGLAQALPGLNIPYIMTLTDYFMICPKVTLMTSEGGLCNGPDGGTACRDLCPEWDAGYLERRIEVARILLGNARFVASPSRFLAGLFNREFQGLNVQAVPHGMRYSLLKRNEKQYREGDRVVFCYAGSLNTFKGVHVLVEAFERVRSGRAVLRIYGSGTDQAYMDRLAADARGDGRIEFCGVYPEDKTGDILSSADTVILPSLWYENYPLVLHEALACNVPVIASDAGGMAEAVVHGKNGFLFEMGDAGRLAELLRQIADDPPVLNRLKQGIDCLASPTIEQEAYVYERIYRQVVNDNN